MEMRLKYDTNICIEENESETTYNDLISAALDFFWHLTTNYACNLHIV